MSSSRRIKSPSHIRELLSGFKNAVLLTHRYADVDALASALAFRYVLSNKYGYEHVSFFCPEGVSAQALNLARRLGLEPSCMDNLKTDFSLPTSNTILIILDAGGLGQLGVFKDLLNKEYKKLLVDHHRKSDLIRLVDYVVMPRQAYSTSEIVAIMFKDMLDNKELAGLLFAGIINDTSRFRRASPMTFKASYSLARLFGYGKLLAMLTVEEELSKRLAKLKAAQRAIVAKSGDYLIVVTHVGSFESDVATSLVSLGADLAVVVSPKDNETRVVVRGSGKINNDMWGRITELFVRNLEPTSHGGHFRAWVFVLGRSLSKKELPSFCKKLSDFLGSALSNA